MDSKEPAYLTVSLFEEINAKYDNQETGSQRSQMLSCIKTFMAWVEDVMLHSSDNAGMKPYDEVKRYHEAIRSCISGPRLWNKAKKERAKLTEDNKKRKQILTPNDEANILKKHKAYLESSRNGEHLRKIIHYGSDSAAVPDNQEWNEMTHTLMGVYIMTTGEKKLIKSEYWFRLEYNM